MWLLSRLGRDGDLAGLIGEGWDPGSGCESVRSMVPRTYRGTNGVADPELIVRVGTPAPPVTIEIGCLPPAPLVPANDCLRPDGP